MTVRAVATEEQPYRYRRHRSEIVATLRSKQLDVETFAVIRARLDAGQALASILATLGLDEESWRELDHGIGTMLHAEARTGHHALGRRYGAAYADEWSRHAPRFVTKL